MSELLDLMQKLAPESLARAPRTERGQFPSEGAPYKPLLLLIVFQRVHDRHPQFQSAQVNYQHVCVPFQRLLPSLYENWTLAVDDDTAVQPFWKLGFGRPAVWNLVIVPGMEPQVDELRRKDSGNQVKTRNRLDMLVQYAEFNDDDWRLIRDPLACDALITFLLASYFGHLAGERGLKERLRNVM